MKLAMRIFVLSVAFAGFAAATVSSSTNHTIASRQSATADLPTPGCGPGIPGCPKGGPGNNQ